MEPISDLSRILQNGSAFQYDCPWNGIQKVTISTHQIGELVVTSGALLAWDLLMGPDTRYHFTRRLKPGCYPVIVSVADFQPLTETRIACAMLLVSNEPTVKWEIAAINNPDAESKNDIFSYGVDSGTGCFMDLDAAFAINELILGETCDSEKFEEYCERVIAEMDQHNFGNGSTSWANMKVSETTEANIIIFSSGWGDGGYASFWGYDASGDLTSLVTDFALF
jgi:hypothetical protein